MTASRATTLEWVLRVGACLCFLGHGAFGVMTKEAWVPYFAVVGIGRESAFALMPVIGALDIAMACLVLVRPINAALAWMTAWAIWTASLRPLAGEPFWEALERAGNYGVPLALLFLGARRGTWRWFAWFEHRTVAADDLVRLRRVLQVTVALLLVGHGALGVLGKHGLTVNLASVMSPSAAVTATPLIGWVELGLAILAFVRVPALLVAIAIWKVATEVLFVTAGAAIWEWVERGGSYAAPLALAIVLVMERQEASEGPTSAS